MSHKCSWEQFNVTCTWRGKHKHVELVGSRIPVRKTLCLCKESFTWVTNCSKYSALLARITTGAQQGRWPGDMTARTKSLKCNLQRRCICTDCLERSLELSFFWVISSSDASLCSKLEQNLLIDCQNWNGIKKDRFLLLITVSLKNSWWLRSQGW